MLKTTFARTTLALAGLLVGASVAATASLAQTPASGAAERPVLVELFTSQGCSSCPPADRYLSTLAERDDTIAISFNVDYWDYLGWRDRLARPAFTQRQKNYAHTRGDGEVYTPQLIVNGRAHLAGSNKPAIAEAIETALQDNKGPAPEIGVKKNGKLATITVSDVPGWSGQATVWVATIARKIETKVHKGENRGRKLVNHNVVRQLLPVGVWTGEHLKAKIDVAMLMKDGADGCLVIIQQDETGPVVAAAWIHSL